MAGSFWPAGAEGGHGEPDPRRRPARVDPVAQSKTRQVVVRRTPPAAAIPC